MSISSPALPPPADGGVPADQVGACLHRLRAVLDKAVDAPAWSLDDRRVETRLGEALAIRAQVDELVARLVRQVDDRDLGRAAGASSTKAHLVASYRVSAGAAAGLVSQARWMTDRTTTTRTAWASGKVSAEQASVIGSAVDKLSATVPDQVVEHAQVDLVDHAQTLTFTQLQVVANHLVEVVDPDAADAVLAEQLEAEEARALQQTTFRGRRGFDGMARFSGKMPNIAYDMPTTALEAIASPRRAANHTTAADGSGAPLSRTGPGAPDPETDPALLTYGRRMGRAFVELLEHLPADKLPNHGAGNATVVVTVDHHKLSTGVGEATLTTGTPVSVSAARRLACNAGVLPAVLGADSAILDPGTQPAAVRPLPTHRPRHHRPRLRLPPAVNDPPPGPKPTTSSPGQTADPPTSTKAACSAASTTTSTTTANGPSRWPPTAPPRPSHPHASTPTRHPSATNASNPDTNDLSPYEGSDTTSAERTSP